MEFVFNIVLNTIKLLLVVATACAMGWALTGCGHNSFMFGQGKVLAITPNGAHYVNGIFTLDCGREQSQFEMEISDANGLAPAPGVSQVKGALRIRRRIRKADQWKDRRTCRQSAGSGIGMA